MPDRLRLTYDMRFTPLSFDFVMSLAFCRAFAERYGLHQRFDVVIYDQGYQKVGVEATYSQDYAARKFREVIVETAMLCSWVRSIFIRRDDSVIDLPTAFEIPTMEMLSKRGKVPEWQITPMVANQLSAILDEGGTISQPGFSASEDVRERFSFIDKNSIVIHPRVSRFSPERNSDKALAAEVAAELARLGFQVFFVPDVEDMRSGFSWSDFPAQPLIDASYDFESRLATAELCATNLLWSGGIAVPLYFSAANFVMTGILNPSNPVSRPDFFERKGPTMNRQPGWLRRGEQVFDWTPSQKITAASLVQQLLNSLQQLQI